MTRLKKVKGSIPLSEISERLSIKIHNLESQMKEAGSQNLRVEDSLSADWKALSDFNACVRAQLGQSSGNPDIIRDDWTDTVTMIDTAERHGIICERQAGGLRDEFMKKVAAVTGVKLNLTPQQTRQLASLFQAPNPVEHLAPQ